MMRHEEHEQNWMLATEILPLRGKSSLWSVLEVAIRIDLGNSHRHYDLSVPARAVSKFPLVV